jgi:hypothetical protein
VTSGGPDYDRDLPDRHAPDPMPHDDAAGTETAAGRSLDVGESGERRTAVDLVLERRDAPRARAVGADPAREEHDPAEAGAAELAEGGREGERAAGEPDRQS